MTHDPHLARKVDRVVAIRDGKISSEMLRKKSYAEELAELEQGITPSSETDSHVEYAVLDKAGRLQLPASYLDSIGIKDSNKVKVELADGKIVIAPPEEAS